MRDIRDIKMNTLNDEMLNGTNFFKKMKKNSQEKIYGLPAKQLLQTKLIHKIQNGFVLKPFEDKDKDSIPNIVDRRPYKKDKVRKIWRIFR